MSTNGNTISHCTDYEDLVRKQLSNSLLSDYDEPITNKTTAVTASTPVVPQKAITQSRRLSSSSCDLTEYKSALATPLVNDGIYSKQRTRSYDSREGNGGLNGVDGARGLKRVTYEDQQPVSNGLQQQQQQQQHTAHPRGEGTPPTYNSEQELSQYLEDTVELDREHQTQGQCSTIRPRHETSTPQSIPPDGSADHSRYDGVDSQSLFTSSLPAIPLSHDDHLPHLDSKTDTRSSRTMKIKAPLVTTRGAGLTSGGGNVDASAGDVRTGMKYPDSSKHVPILSANNRPLSAKESYRVQDLEDTVASLKRVLVQREKEVDELRAVQRDSEAHIRQLRDKASEKQNVHQLEEAHRVAADNEVELASLRHQVATFQTRNHNQNHLEGVSSDIPTNQQPGNIMNGDCNEEVDEQHKNSTPENNLQHRPSSTGLVDKPPSGKMSRSSRSNYYPDQDGSHPPTSTDASDVSRLRSLTGDLHTESVVRNRHPLDSPHRTALTQSASTDCIPNATSTDISNYSPNNPRALQRKIADLQSQIQDLQEVNESTVSSLRRAEQQLRQLREDRQPFRPLQLDVGNSELHQENQLLRQRVQSLEDTDMREPAPGKHYDPELHALRQSLRSMREKNNQLTQDNITLTEYIRELEIRPNTAKSHNSSLNRTNVQNKTRTDEKLFLNTETTPSRVYNTDPYMVSGKSYQVPVSSDLEDDLVATPRSRDYFGSSKGFTSTRSTAYPTNTGIKLSRKVETVQDVIDEPSTEHKHSQHTHNQHTHNSILPHIPIIHTPHKHHYRRVTHTGGMTRTRVSESSVDESPSVNQSMEIVDDQLSQQSSQLSEQELCVDGAESTSQHAEEQPTVPVLESPHNDIHIEQHDQRDDEPTDISSPTTTTKGIQVEDSICDKQVYTEKQRSVLRCTSPTQILKHFNLQDKSPEDILNQDDDYLQTEENFRQAELQIQNMIAELDLDQPRAYRRDAKKRRSWESDSTDMLLQEAEHEVLKATINDEQLYLEEMTRNQHHDGPTMSRSRPLSSPGRSMAMPTGTTRSLSPCNGTGPAGYRTVVPKVVSTQHNKQFSSPHTRTQSVTNKRPFAPTLASDINIGDVVKFSRQGGKISKGLVHYLGHLPGKNDNYVGVELEHELGTHDGIYEGNRYFTCKPQRGVFVSFSKVVMVWSDY